MSRRTREYRLDAEAQWPLLVGWLVEFFGLGVFHKFETLTEARKTAVSSLELSDQKRLAAEWWDWNARVASKGNLPNQLDAYGVDWDFESDSEVREFMNGIYDELIVVIRNQERGWKP